MSEQVNADINSWPIDLTQFLAPIPGANPSGESLRYDPLYDQIQTARRADDPALPQGVWQTELKTADWAQVAQRCGEALTTRTKDLQLAAWLLDAWLHLHGLTGVTAGLHLLNALCTNFWPTLYPELQAEDPGARLAPVCWLNEKVALQLKQLPITQPLTQEVAGYTWADRETVLQWEKLAKQSSAGSAVTTNGAVTQAALRKSIMLTPTPFYVDLAAQIDSALAAAQQLAAFLDAQCGADAPSLAQLTAVLEEIHQMAENMIRTRHDGENGADSVHAGASLPVTPTTLPAGTVIHSRDEAYQMLAAIADYLLRIEPHSPAPFLIKRAVSWGSMSLTELLLELVQNSNDRQAIFALLGIKQGKD